MSNEFLFRKINRNYKYLRTTAVFIEVATECHMFERASPLVIRHQEKGGSITLCRRVDTSF